MNYFLVGNFKRTLSREEENFLRESRGGIIGKNEIRFLSPQAGEDFSFLKDYVVSLEFLIIKENFSEEERGYKVEFFEVKEEKFLPTLFSVESDGKEKVWQEAKVGGEFYSLFLHFKGEAEITKFFINEEWKMQRKTVLKRSYLSDGECCEERLRELEEFNKESVNGIIQYIISNRKKLEKEIAFLCDKAKKEERGNRLLFSLEAKNFQNGDSNGNYYNRYRR